MAIPVLSTTLLEGTTGLYTFTLIDDVGDGIDASFLTSLTLTYYDRATQAIVNGRDTQNALNANDVTVLTDPGPPLVTTVTWELQPDDTVIVNEALQSEYRVIQFRWSWDSGTRHGASEVQFAVHAMLFVG